MNEKEFFVGEYINKIKNQNIPNIRKNENISDEKSFYILCDEIKKYFHDEWDKQYNNNDEVQKALELQKKAIIGFPKEVRYFKDKVEKYLNDNNIKEHWFPKWYKNIVDGVFHENWGLAGLSEFFLLEDSSSAKVIGERVFFQIKGEQKLMPQKINTERMNQLIKALLLKTPKLRHENYAEVYTIGGERIAIYDEGIVKEGQRSIVIRNYVVKDYRFEEQAKRKTIPKEIIPLFYKMIELGYNVAFLGPVKSAKTTFLQTWQRYENPKLEGVLIETDPEIPIHRLLPTAPIQQIVADGEKLKGIIKPLMRSDADYLILAEARDGVACYIAVKAANKGTRRVKMTYHTTDITDFCYDVADDIVKEMGGSLENTIIKTAKSFQFLFQFKQLQDKSQKRLKTIYQLEYDRKKRQVIYNKICSHNAESDSWEFNYAVGETIAAIGVEENPEAFKLYKQTLKELSEKFPMRDKDTEIIPYYSNGGIDSC